MFTQDFIANGAGHGEVGQALGQMNFDPGYMRPYIGNDDERYVVINEHTGSPQKVRIADLMSRGIHSPVFNATALRKDEWVSLDNQVIKAARQRLRAWSDLAAANSMSVPGMSKTVLEHETMEDVGEAVVDMDGLSEARNDTPRFQLEGLPLPITHSGFHFGSRKLATSRNSGTPLDTSMAEMAGRRVAEQVEKTLIGTVAGLQYGNASEYGRSPKIYGYTNYPDRIVDDSMTAPDGTNGPTILNEWLGLRELLYDANHYGPFMAYVSNDYDQYLDGLFSTTEPSAGSLRKRLLEIDNISGIKRLDYLSGPFNVILVQMTSDVARAINGMNITTIQWESRGGMQLNFKVMCIWVPQLRSDFAGNCGIAHGSTS